MFAERGVSALPIIDRNGKVVDIYARFDVIVSTVISFQSSFSKVKENQDFI